jgi:hypothetical protein
MTADHKDYALKQLENFLYDAMSADATAQEIYDVIKGVVEDNYNVYKNATQKAYELLALLNGNGVGHISDATSRGNQIHQEVEDLLQEYPVSKVEEKLKTPIQQNPHYTDEEMDAMTAAEEKELIAKGFIKVNGFRQKPKTSWIVKVEMDGLTGDAIIPIPDDLSDIAGWDVDDELEWHHQGDGSYIIRKMAK